MEASTIRRTCGRGRKKYILIHFVWIREKNWKKKWVIIKTYVTSYSFMRDRTDEIGTKVSHRF